MKCFVLLQVAKMQRLSSYIAVYSDCTLSRGEVYSLCCNVVEGDMIQPKVNSYLIIMLLSDDVT